MSSRRCSLYLGDKVQIASGASTIILDKRDNSATSITGLLTNRSGTGVEMRQGDTRRRVLPTDADETQLPSTIPGYQLFNGQEATTVVRTASPNPLFATTGQEMARLSLGDVYNDLGVPTVSLTGGITRSLLATKDDAGLLDLFTMTVDNTGSLGIFSMGRMQITSTLSYLLTALADATITAGVTLSLVSTAAMSLTSGATLSLTSTGTTTVTAPLIQLGSNAAIQPAVLGTLYSSLLTTLISTFVAWGTSVQASTAASASVPSNAPCAVALLALGAAAVGLGQALSSSVSPLIANTVSTKVFLE
jgi:hypothetical protein